jgi:hypothetical protein
MKRIIVKPQTHLAIDMFLFALLVTLATSALMQHAADNDHVRFMFHALHGLAGTAMCLTVSLHLRWPPTFDKWSFGVYDISLLYKIFALQTNMENCPSYLNLT